MSYKNSPFYKYLHTYQDQPLPQKKTAHIGIGGSGLGPKMISQLLGAEDKYKVFDHLNFEELEKFKPEQLVVVSKSGTTLESLFILRQALEEIPHLKNNLILVSDGDAGDIVELSRALSCTHIKIPKDLGGRYSVFSAVGGVTLNILGHSIKEFTSFNMDHAEKLGNKFAEFALQSDRKNICLWCYNSKIDLLADWFCQLWGESLGKNKQGIFPVPVKGPRDQHSLLQYFMQGNVSHAHVFVHAPLNKSKTLKDPLWSKLSTLKNYPHSSLADLQKALFEGTSNSLKENGNPILNLEINANLNDLGSICFSLMIATVKVAENWAINPFDQPGVERAKEIARAMLLKR